MRRDSMGRVTLSPSNYYRATLCSGSIKTPLVPETPPGWAAKRGTAVHKALAEADDAYLWRHNIIPEHTLIYGREVQLLRDGVSGTADLVYQDESGLTVVADYKTGKLDRPEYIMQVQIYTYLAQADRGCLIQIDPKTYDVVDRLWVDKKIENIPCVPDIVSYNKGTHCKYCPVGDSRMCPEMLRT